VDIFNDFSLKTCFGSFPVQYLLEKHIFEVVVPSIIHFFELRLPFNPDQREMTRKLIKNL